jgi:glyoxylase-like metal-dependent hydrolase (beta-lactamase superfamily II)
VANVLERKNKRVEQIFLTHGHLDHSAGAMLFADRTGCNVRALDPSQRLGDEGLVDGEVVRAGGTEIAIVATPGHTADSLSFVIEEDGSILTGDTVLGRGTTVVAYPDGQLADYLDSLQRLGEIVSDRSLTSILPGHGPSLSEPAAVIAAYLAHRQDRLDQVDKTSRAIAESAPGEVRADELAQQVVEIVYADVPRSVWPAALLSVRAQLDFLNSRGASNDQAR